jgi:hypothetical protein
MRAQIHHYVKGMPNAGHFRREANQLSTLKGLYELVTRYAQSLRTQAPTEVSK